MVSLICFTHLTTHWLFFQRFPPIVLKTHIFLDFRHVFTCLQRAWSERSDKIKTSATLKQHRTKSFGLRFISPQGYHECSTSVLDVLPSCSWRLLTLLWEAKTWITWSPLKSVGTFKILFGNTFDALSKPCLYLGEESGLSDFQSSTLLCIRIHCTLLY